MHIFTLSYMVKEIQGMTGIPNYICSSSLLQNMWFK